MKEMKYPNEAGEFPHVLSGSMGSPVVALSPVSGSHGRPEDADIMISGHASPVEQRKSTKNAEKMLRKLLWRSMAV